MKTFILIVKLLVIPAFFVIANTSNILIGNAIAGVMTIAVIAVVGFEWINKSK
jgi:hypothetical protein